MPWKPYMINAKGKSQDEFALCFNDLRGKTIQITDTEEVMIIGIVDEKYDFEKNKNYKLLDAVPLISGDVINKMPQYIGKFDTIEAIYTAEK
jgi:hypothetical protein